MSEESEITLGDLARIAPDRVIEIARPGRPPFRATAHELLTAARLPAFLSLEEVRFAFSN